MIKDTHQLQGFNTPKMPKLKGHIKIKLHNVHNGKNEVYEGDNIITNVVYDLFANNYLGCVDYTKLWGSDGLWKTWFGGVLCYESAHPTVQSQLDPDDYFPQADSDNHLTAHAGQIAIDPNHDDDNTRGNPITASYVETEDSHKVVFEWGTTKGNGNISALSLTHSDTGSYGLGNTSYDFQNTFVPYDNIKSSVLASVTTSPLGANNLVAMYDDNHGIGYVIGDAGEYDGSTPNGTLFATDKITIFVRRLPYQKAGLFETLSARTSYQRQFVVEDLPFTLYSMPSYYFDYTNKRLWIFSNITGLTTESSWSTVRNSQYSKDHLNYAVIDCTENPQSRIVTSGTLVSTSQNLSPTSIGKARAGSWNQFQADRFFGVIIDGDYLYFPTSSDTPVWGDFAYTGINWKHNGFKKFKISTGVDTGAITFNTDKVLCTPPIIGGGIIIENNRVCNGATGYSCNNFFTEPQDSGLIWNFQQINKISTAVFPLFSQRGSSSQERYILANKMVNTSKYNLPSTIQKTASQSMSVEYVLREVSDAE